MLNGYHDALIMKQQNEDGFASIQLNFKPQKFSWTLQKYETVGAKHTGTFENILFIDPSNTWLNNEAGCSLQDIAATYLVG